MKNLSFTLFMMFCIIIACELPGPQEDKQNKEQQVTQTEMIKIEGSPVDPFGSGETVNVSSFYIDKHLVTYQQYNKFIEDGGYKQKKYWSEEGRKFLKKYEYWVTSTYHEKHLNSKSLPVTGVSWYEAEAYANWRGARLPTAAEWTLACQGNTEQRYPWGDEFDFEAVEYRTRLVPYAVGTREKTLVLSVFTILSEMCGSGARMLMRVRIFDWR